jgi:hypothetical protein
MNKYSHTSSVYTNLPIFVTGQFAMQLSYCHISMAQEWRILVFLVMVDQQMVNSSKKILK